MHGILTEHFLNQFYLKENKGKTENYAVCLGMLRCLQSPYFEGQHDTWSLEHTSDDKTFLNYTQSGRQHRWEMVDLSDVDTHSLLDKEEAKKKAQSYIDLLDDQTKCLLFHPTTQDFHNKHDLTMEVIDGEHISKRLVALLGPYATSNLGQEGHTYHNLPHYSDKNHWQFVIAHNKREIGGCLVFTTTSTTIALFCLMSRWHKRLETKGSANACFNMLLIMSKVTKNYWSEAQPVILVMRKGCPRLIMISSPSNKFCMWQPTPMPIKHYIGR